MGLSYGIAAAAANLGVQAVLVKPKRALGPFEAHVTLSERHVDELEVTDHPVELGAQISDHAFKRPSEVTIECAWSDSPRSGSAFGGLARAVAGTVEGVQSILTGNSPDQVRDVYDRLLQLQRSVIPFDVYTGKRVYRDMLLKSLTVETDKEREHVLQVTAVLRQILIATTRVTQVSAPVEEQADPEATCPNTDKGVRQLSADVPSLNLAAAVDSLTPGATDLVLGGTP